MRTLAIVLAALLAIPAPALAVRKIEKKSKGQSAQADNAGVNQDQAAEDKSPADNPQQPQQGQESQKDVSRKKLESSSPEKEDRFIDENSDGINDRISKQPAVKVKRREPPRIETPKRETQKRENPERETSKKPEKMKRRDR